MTEQAADPVVERLLTIDEVADIYKVPVSTVRLWRAKGLPPHGFIVGRLLRWHPKTVREDMTRRAAEVSGLVAAARGQARESAV